MRYFLAVILCMFFISDIVFAEVIFDNTDTSEFTGFGPSCCHVGNEISLGGNYRTISKISWLIDSQNHDVLLEGIETKIYAMDGTGGSPGRLLWESGIISNIFIRTSDQYIHIDVPEIVVPDVIIVTSKILGATPVAVGRVHVNPVPYIGSFTATWIKSSNGVWNQGWPDDNQTAYGLRVEAIAPINNPPIADAGDDVTVYAGADGTATVKLDGSGSYDNDGDVLKYLWYEGGDQIATDIDPNVVLEVGEHVIDLVVNDGSLNSEPDSVVITVLEMPNTTPVADAGDDITVFAGLDGTATVKLDGSGSFDADADALEYFWFNDANELIAEGVDPNVVFAAGEQHVIELVVDDGTVSSEPNSVVVTVIEAVEAQARVYPRVLNITSRGRFVIARMQLPAGITKDDVADDSLVLIIGGVTIESVRQRAVTSMDRHYVFAFFDRSEVIAQAEGKPKLDIIIAGKLTTGQCIYGEDSIKLVKSNGPKKPLPSRKPVRNSRGRQSR